jgi:ABC-2 type transport system permease protein
MGLRRPLLALIRKDAKLFAVDRQAVVMSVLIPILIASILGWLDSSAGKEVPDAKVKSLFVDLDHSKTSILLRSRLTQRKDLALIDATEPVALNEVKKGEFGVAIVIPKGFEKLAGAALSGGISAPLTLLKDPSQPSEAQLVEASLIETASKTVAEQAYGALADRGSPINLNVQTVASGKATWGQSAHDYSGFGLQGLLFFAVESAVALARERRSGVWKRLKSAPVSVNLILFSRGISSTLLSLAIILSMFLIGGVLFGIRVLGSYAGFFAIAISAALMAASFGLLMSTLGKTETQSRALSILIIFLMLATGGAWFPLSKMPIAVQNLAEFLPVRWAVEGFDAMTWRGLAFQEAGKSASILFAFSAAFIGVAVLRFRALSGEM